MMSFNIPANETPEQARQRMLAASEPTSMPTNVGSGLQAVAEALMAREHERQDQFPVAPGGAKPSMMTSFKNMFGLGGGLY